MLIPTLAFIGSIGGYEWLIVLVIALLLFGRRLPEMMRSVGSGMREFKRGIGGDDGPSQKG